MRLREILANIIKQQVKLEDLKSLRELEEVERNALVEVLEKILSNEQLHALNNKIFEYARDLSDDDDPAFLCREPKNYIFKMLFYIEAKKENFGVKVENNKLAFLTADNIPAFMQDHYSTLLKGFYKEVGKDNLNKFMAQSMYFVFYSYWCNQKISDAEILGQLKKVNDLEGEYIKKLVDAKISENIKSLDKENGQVVLSEQEVDNQIKSFINRYKNVFSCEVIETAQKLVKELKIDDDKLKEKIDLFLIAKIGKYLEVYDIQFFIDNDIKLLKIYREKFENFLNKELKDKFEDSWSKSLTKKAQNFFKSKKSSQSDEEAAEGKLSKKLDKIIKESFDDALKAYSVNNSDIGSSGSDSVFESESASQDDFNKTDVIGDKEDDLNI